MKTLPAAIASLVCLAATGLAADSPKDAAKWRTLFDGKSLDGWEHVGPGKMVLQDGMLRTEGGMGLLWYTKEKFGDCRLRVAYKTTDKASNAGVFVRIADKPKDEWYAVHHGYEVQICDVGDPFHSTGAVYSLSKATAKPAKPPGEWNTMIITLKGPIVTVEINGEVVNRFDPGKPVPDKVKSFEPDRGPRPESGYIGLQNHDDYAKGTEVYFKDVAVAPVD